MIKIGRATAENIIKMDSRSIVCFGAGKDFIRFCHDNDIADRVLIVADNYIAGGLIKIDGKEIRVLKFIGAAQIKECIYIISTKKYAQEIVKQLDSMHGFDNDIFYVMDMDFFDNEESTDSNYIQKFMSAIPRIPKIIHYFWFGGNAIPYDFKKNIESWHKFCPDYEIRLWNEDNYDVEKNCYMKQAYQAKKWGFVPDYARLDVINKYGGIYLDVDVELVKPLDDLRYFELYCGFESKKSVNFGQGFGSAGNSIILDEMMRAYDNIKFINDDGSLNLTPSPAYQTKVLQDHGLILNGKTQGTTEFVAFSTQSFSPISDLGIGSICKNTYSIHKYAATWFDEEQLAIKENDMLNAKYLLNRINSDNAEE